MFVAIHSKRIEDKLDEIACLLKQVLKGQEQATMTPVTVDKDQVDAVNSAFSQLKTTVTTAFTDLAAKIEGLQTKTTDPATASELGDILGGIKDLTSTAAANDPGPVVPIQAGS